MLSKKYVNIILIVILTVSVFSVGFVLSVISGMQHSLNTTMNSLPFNQIIVGKIMPKGFTQNALNKNFSKNINIENILLVAACEISPFQMLSPSNVPAKQPHKDDFIPISEQDVKKIKSMSGVRDAFLYNPIDNIYNIIPSVNGRVIENVNFFCLPPKFFKELHFPLKYGQYFDGKSDKEVVLSDDFAKFAFGTDDVVGKTIYGNGKKYKVVGILKKFTPEEENALPFNFVFSRYVFAPTPKNYLAGGDLKFRNSPTDLRVLNTIIVLPKKGYEKKVSVYIHRMLEQKIINKNIGLTPEVDSSFDHMSYSLNVQSSRVNLFYVLLASLFMILISLLTISEFIFLSIIMDSRKIALKRMIGATNRDIKKEKIWQHFYLSLVSWSLSILLLFIAKLKIKSVNLSGVSSILKLNTNISMNQASTLIINFTIVTALLLFTIFVIIISTNYGWKMFQKLHISNSVFEFPMYYNSKKFTVVALIIALSVSVGGAFGISAVRNYGQQQILLFSKEVKPNIARIVAGGGDIFNTFSFSYKDYISIKKKFTNDAIVGFREDEPEWKTYKINGKNILRYRLSQATENFPSIFDFRVEKGRFLNDNDIGVCVIGSGIAKKTKLKIGDIFGGFKIIGIIGKTNPLVDYTVFIPVPKHNLVPIYSSISRNKGCFLIKCENPDKTSVVAQKILNFIKNKHNSHTDIGKLINFSERFKLVENSFRFLYLILSIFTFLALLSSFLSLSALLFIEVIRKKREIGIKKAIGATRREITKEFTLKGLKTTVIALIIGIPIGILISLIIEKLKGWNYYIPINILILVIFISFLLGLIFSFLPAYFASKTNPVEAIKSE